ncbi:PTS system fructose-specific IIC component [Rhizomicrobium palustre]|uniref:protein-N(pi)-phosphohistidine--D-fructose phosphotransferase n=1 Tax=Rhizomicrobium palustre TaxID=189966 RepID=A0A846N1Q2_9PROT|nr:fructose-specific PTS transporter subunit EIIC [Rhizomicrobium palustre]NIK89533.1 PTS system fructose-specific IIC component [Rhizomicrobium palustre]
MTLPVIIGDSAKTAQALLAAESLRKAAAVRGLDVAVEVRVEGVTLNALPTAQLTDETVIVGAPDGDLPKTQRHFTIEAMLADAGACLDQLGSAESKKAFVVAVTSCPTGIAHTFMAAEGLKAGAEKLGYDIRVETQGSVGSNDTLSEDEIARADVVIVAADRQVSTDRFGGKKLFVTGTKPAIKDGAALISQALTEAKVQGAAAAPSDAAAKPQGSPGVYKHLMTGVSFMLPFVVAGGLMIALAFALGGIYAGNVDGTFANALFKIGAKAAFTLMVPALAGYIAFSIADRPGIAPGMIGGVLAAQVGAGFLGGILAGFIAGYAVKLLTKYIRLPQGLEGLKPVLILPLLGTAITGLAMIYVVGTPMAQILAALTNWLQGLRGANAWALGAILGGMMAVDMGGPVNKAAYAFSTGLLTSNIFAPMAATMAGGMVPPLALFLATRFFANRFTSAEHQSGPATALLGLSFITEGALPYVARDPLRVIPALIAGSATAGALALAFGTELRVPHGGVFVMLIPNAVSHVAAYALAILIGSAVGAIALRLTLRRQA